MGCQAEDGRFQTARDFQETAPTPRTNSGGHGSSQYDSDDEDSVVRGTFYSVATKKITYNMFSVLNQCAYYIT